MIGRTVLLAATIGAGANAASFDCARARLPDERAICADRALNDQDVRMALLLDVVGHGQIMGANGAMRDDQRAWLAERRACRADRACLRRVYATRVDTLLTAARAYAERNR